MVGGLFGKVLHVLKSLPEEKDLSVSRVAVLAGEAARIREVVKIAWKERVYRVWIEEEQEDWVPDCLGFRDTIGLHRFSSAKDSPGCNDDVESPMASSPVVEVSKVNGQGGGFEGNEGSCMAGDASGSQEAAGVGPEGSVGLGNNEGSSMEGGAVNNDKSAGGGSDNVHDIRNVFNYECFLGNESGSSSAPVGKKGPFVFKSSKKSKRQRKGACNIQGKSFVQLDSSEKARPSKRNRAQIEEDNDPFSIDKLLGPKFNRDLKEDGEKVVSSGSAVEPSSPGSRRQFDLNHRAAPDFSSSWRGRGEEINGDVGEGDNDVDQEVLETVRLGVQLGMELGNKEDLVKKVIQGTGLGGGEKVNWIKRIIGKFGISFVALQESKCISVDKVGLDRLWAGKVFDFDWVASSGRSGGLINVWDKKLFDRVGTVKHKNFLISKGIVKGGGQMLNIVNVYAPQDLQSKVILWRELLAEMVGQQGGWIFLGDFNSVRVPEERLNMRFNPACAKEFNDFIFSAGLLEYEMKERKFTRWASDGRKLSKIDRVLVCAEFFGYWPEACLRALPKELSDHCPLVLITKDVNFGPKPFRVFNSWLDRPGFDVTVREAASNFEGVGPADLRLLKKFEFIRKHVKEWRDELLKKEGEEEARARAELEELEIIKESRDLVEEEEWVLSENDRIIKELEENKTKDLKQRSRVKWARDGDENSRFFHTIINCRRASNRIHGLYVNGYWSSKPSIIKKNVFQFFRDKFKEDVVNRPFVRSDNIKKISDQESVFLVDKFSTEELKEAVADCGGDRAPGPDGFNFKFLKHFWDIFEGDFVEVLNEFHSRKEVSRGCASSFITLIPKVKDATCLNEYRPISLVGAINKVLSKVLANRLKKVLPSVISESQSAFLKGKFILDGPLIINEVINWFKKCKRKAFLLKLDFEKAYDNVNWGFLRDAMLQMGFPCVWCEWVHAILSSARSAVLVNGSPTFDFQCEKGMRQGDPLSPFLFLIVMEVLSCCFEKAVMIGVVPGVYLPNNGPVLSHLFYADDALIIGDWREDTIKNIVRILRGFHICSGLKINLSKSNIYGIGSSEVELDLMAARIGCNKDVLPFKYLGISVGANMNRISSWSPVIDIFKCRLSLWKASVLSIGGRITLIKSVMECLPNYFFSMFKAPAGVIRQLEYIMRRFLWGGPSLDKKLSWVSWDRVTSPIDKGGLEKKFMGENGSGYSRHLREVGVLPVKSSLGGVWVNIVKIVNKPFRDRNCFLHFVEGTVGNGEDFAFWLDPWLLKEPLRFRFPNLFRLEVNKKCKVRDRIVRPITNPGASWQWKSAPASGVELAEWLALCVAIRDISLSDGSDRWRWSADVTGEFSVFSAKSLMDSISGSREGFVMEWCKWVPLKCNVFAWRAEMERLPTRLELAKRNIPINGTSCPLCDDGEESASHLFTACRFATEVWAKVCSWAKTPFLVAFSLRDVLNAHVHCGLKGKQQFMFQGIVVVTCWIIWRARNDRVFNGKIPKADDVFRSIKSAGYLWFKNRCKYIDTNWDKWCNFE
ncbi:putative RNA-directed DNA polymerase [Helianthus anomalus]